MVLLARLMGAGILLIAASLKAYELIGNPALGTLYGSKWLEAGLVEYEVLLASWLLTGVAQHWCRWTMLATFFGFGCYATYVGVLGDVSCGCFGPVQVNPWWTLGLDCIALIFLWRWTPAATKLHFAFLAAALAIAVVFSLAVVGSLLVQPKLAFSEGFLVEDSIVFLQPEQWVGNKFLLADYVDRGEKLMKGTWTVLLYHHDCPKCQEVLHRYDEMALFQTNHVMLIEVPPFGERALFDGADIGHLRDDIDWFVTTPIEISLLDGRVTAVASDGNRMPTFGRHCGGQESGQEWDGR
jgi:hypothetical protein